MISDQLVKGLWSVLDVLLATVLLSLLLCRFPVCIAYTRNAEETSQ